MYSSEGCRESSRVWGLGLGCSGWYSSEGCRVHSRPGEGEGEGEVCVKLWGCRARLEQDGVWWGEVGWGMAGRAAGFRV